MTITRETLELAAKAAGIELAPSTWDVGAPWGAHEGFIVAGEGLSDEWAPQHNHGQLLDLAMACKMVLYFDIGRVECYQDVVGWIDYKLTHGDFPSLAESVITAAAEQQQAKGESD